MERKLSKQNRETKGDSKGRLTAKEKDREIFKLRQEVAVLKKSASGKDTQ